MRPLMWWSDSTGLIVQLTRYYGSTLVQMMKPDGAFGIGSRVIHDLPEDAQALEPVPHGADEPCDPCGHPRAAHDMFVGKCAEHCDCEEWWKRK